MKPEKTKENNYMTDELTDSTGTYRPPTIKETEDKLIDVMREYDRRKWYQFNDKAQLLKTAKHYAHYLNFLDKLK